MVKRIESLQDLRRVPIGAVVFYKVWWVFGTNRPDGDGYAVGIVVPRKICPAFRSGFESGLLDAARRVYHSSAMDKVRAYHDAWGNRWDSEPCGTHTLTRVEHELGGLPPRKDVLLLQCPPVPEDSSTVRRFAEALEAQLYKI